MNVLGLIRETLPINWDKWKSRVQPEGDGLLTAWAPPEGLATQRFASNATTGCFSLHINELFEGLIVMVYTTMLPIFAAN